MTALLSGLGVGVTTPALAALPGATLVLSAADPASMFVERTGAAATTLAALNGPVGTWRYGGVNFTAPSDAARWIRRSAGGASWVESDGFDDVFNGPALSTFIGAGAYELAIAGRFLEAATNSANPYDNDLALVDASGFFAAAFVKSTGVMGAYNWDTNADSVTAAYAPGADFVWQQRHESGYIIASLNGGPEVSVASGNTSSLAAAVQIGRRTTAYAKMRIHAIFIANAVQTAEARAAIRRAMAAANGVPL